MLLLLTITRILYIYFTYLNINEGIRKKKYFSSCPVTKRGRGGKGLAAKKKELFLKFKKTFPQKIWPLSPRG